MPRLERVSLVEFMEEIEVNAALQAEGHGLHPTINHADGDAAIDADCHCTLGCARERHGRGVAASTPSLLFACAVTA